MIYTGLSTLSTHNGVLSPEECGEICSGVSNCILAIWEGGAASCRLASYFNMGLKGQAQNTVVFHRNCGEARCHGKGIIVYCLC